MVGPCACPADWVACFRADCARQPKGIYSGDTLAEAEARGFQRGQEAMRERAAHIVESQTELQGWKRRVAIMIRALPINPTDEV